MTARAYRRRRHPQARRRRRRQTARRKTPRRRRVAAAAERDGASLARILEVHHARRSRRGSNRRRDVSPATFLDLRESRPSSAVSAAEAARFGPRSNPTAGQLAPSHARVSFPTTNACAAPSPRRFVSPVCCPACPSRAFRRTPRRFASRVPSGRCFDDSRRGEYAAAAAGDAAMDANAPVTSASRSVSRIPASRVRIRSSISARRALSVSSLAAVAASLSATAATAASARTRVPPPPRRPPKNQSRPRIEPSAPGSSAPGSSAPGSCPSSLANSSLERFPSL